MKRVAFVTCVGLLTAASAVAEKAAQGTIRGLVANEHGQPVESALVTADLADGRPRLKAIRYVETDKQGQFVIDQLEWGPYRIYAMKESEGYPDAYYSVYSEGPNVTAQLSPQSPNASVRVVIGPKAAVVVGTISDAVTGTPVNAGVRIWRWANTGDFLSTSVRPNYRMLIPPNTQVGFEVQAPGYRPWFYPGAATLSSSGPLTMRSEEKLTLDIKLQPE